MADLYATLDVPRDASEAAIRKAYRKASKRAHPDGGGTPEKFRAVNQAMQVLTDPLRRKTYDETGKIEDKPVDNEQSELMGLVSALLDAVLQNCDQEGIPYEHADLIQRMTRLAYTRLQDIHKQRAQLKANIAKQRKMFNRFKRKGDGENLMENLIIGRLAFLEGQEAMGQRHLDQMKKAEAFIAGYKFESEKMTQQSVNYYVSGTMGGGVW